MKRTSTRRAGPLDHEFRRRWNFGWPFQRHAAITATMVAVASHIERAGTGERREISSTVSLMTRNSRAEPGRVSSQVRGNRPVVKLSESALCQEGAMRRRGSSPTG